ncbi:MAG: hydroxymethylbilane synthase [Chloroflexi bacterium]|nr:hydroxymethylbilane synthase [Chloroflexota bacterium]
MKLRIATRGSALARWQAEHVGALLTAVDPTVRFELVLVETSGDRDRHRPIWEIGGKGVFVKEVQTAVIEGRADVAVHSAKDLPAAPTPGLRLVAVPERADPRDALVGSTLAGLPTGATIATGSVRRRAQLADLRPDLTFAGLRGNIETRLAKATAFDAVVVAAAALDRLGLADAIAERLEPSVLLPQVGQGALAIECGVDAADLMAVVAAVEDPASRRAVDAERAFLAELGGDCDLPAGAHAVALEDELRLDVLLASLDGHVVLRHRAVGSDPDPLGRDAARHLLDRAGGASLAVG